ncbi:MAG: hypothetical protein K2X47_15545 [Bdellovibrionales bacterium]|nr:hypothetical protein [Bdellovibrionales bacterium]
MFSSILFSLLFIPHLLQATPIEDKEIKLDPAKNYYRHLVAGPLSFFEDAKFKKPSSLRLDIKAGKLLFNKKVICEWATKALSGYSECADPKVFIYLGYYAYDIVFELISSDDTTAVFKYAGKSYYIRIGEFGRLIEPPSKRPARWAKTTFAPFAEQLQKCTSKIEAEQRKCMLSIMDKNFRTSFFVSQGVIRYVETPEELKAEDFPALAGSLTKCLEGFQSKDFSYRDQILEVDQCAFSDRSGQWKFRGYSDPDLEAGDAY